MIGPVLVIAVHGRAARETLTDALPSYRANLTARNGWHTVRTRGPSYAETRTMIERLGVRASLRCCRCIKCASGALSHPRTDCYS